MNKKYTLSELLSQCSSATSVGINEELQAWLDMRPIGREIITISNDDFDHMMQLLETPPKPTAKLLAAAQAYKSSRSHKPSKTTIKAIQEAKNGKLPRFRSVDELMYSLNQPQIAYTRFRRELRKIMKQTDETGPIAITRAGKIVGYCVSPSLFNSFQLLASHDD
jgi:PHD/YefM family antitoxin component YafN of YafNO toxin-antitoxin module